MEELDFKILESDEFKKTKKKKYYIGKMGTDKRSLV